MKTIITKLPSIAIMLLLTVALLLVTNIDQVANYFFDQVNTTKLREHTMAAKKKEKTKIQITAETMLGDLMKLVVDEIKALPDAWAKLSQEKQDDSLERIQKRCSGAIEKCVNIIALGDYETVTATVDSVTFKGDVKATLKIPVASKGAHALADHGGSQVRIVISDPEQFGGTKTAPKSDPQQPSFIDDGKDTPEDSLYGEAVEYVTSSGKTSISALQRKMKVGYNRAAAILQAMESKGVLSPMSEKGMRTIL